MPRSAGLAASETPGETIWLQISRRRRRRRWMGSSPYQSAAGSTRRAPRSRPSRRSRSSRSRARSSSAGQGSSPAGEEQCGGEPHLERGEPLQARQGEQGHHDLRVDLRFRGRQPVEAGFHPAGGRRHSGAIGEVVADVGDQSEGGQGRPPAESARDRNPRCRGAGGRRGSGSRRRRSGRARRRRAPRQGRRPPAARRGRRSTAGRS